MTVTASSYEAVALGNAVRMLSACASFQAMVGAASAAAALGSIIESVGGNPGENAGKKGMAIAVDGAEIDLGSSPHAIVGLVPGLSSSGGSIGYYDRDFTIRISLIQLRRLSDTELPSDMSRRAWNNTGLIRDQLEAQKGSAGALADFEANSDGLFMDEEGVGRNSIITEITITARG